MTQTPHLLSLLPLLALGACSGGPDDSVTPHDSPAPHDSDSAVDTATDDSGVTDDTATDDTGGHPCYVAVEATSPANGSTSAYYRSDIAFTLSDPDASAVITTAVAGHQATSSDGLTVSWVLDAPMDPSTAYTATLDYCAGSVALSFTTSNLGTPMDDPASLLGRTYAVDLASARITEPPGIGSVLSGYLTTDILLGVSAVDGGSLDMLGAVARADVSPDEQDTCSPTFPFPTADFTAEPYFAVGPQTVTLSIGGYDVDISDLQITGTFASDGTYFGGGTLSGSLDTRPLSALVDDSGDPGAICDLAINFGAECIACPSDGEPYCLTLVADEILAEQVRRLTLVDVGGTNCMDCMSPTDTTDLSETCEIDPNL